MPAVAPGRAKKFSRRWRGPYQILEMKLPAVKVKLSEKLNSEPFWVHVNRVKPFFQTDSNLLSFETSLNESQPLSGKCKEKSPNMWENKQSA